MMELSAGEESVICVTVKSTTNTLENNPPKLIKNNKNVLTFWLCSILIKIMEFVVKLAAITNVFTSKCIAFGKLVTDVNEINNRNYTTEGCFEEWVWLYMQSFLHRPGLTVSILKMFKLILF